MSILWRSWITFTAIIATVLIALAVLSSLQHNALYSDLIRQRLSVVAQTSAASFQSVVKLGLPISMVRNASELLTRAQQTDSEISAIHAFNPSGIIVKTTDPTHPGTVPKQVVQAQYLAETSEWSVESDSELFSGVNILNAQGSTVAGIVVVYPKQEFESRSNAVINHIAITTLGLLIIFSAAAWLLLRLRLAGAIRALSRLDSLLTAIRHDDHSTQPAQPMTETQAAKLGFLRKSIRIINTLFSLFHQEKKEIREAVQSWNTRNLTDSSRYAQYRLKRLLLVLISAGQSCRNQPPGMPTTCHYFCSQQFGE